MTSTSGPYSMAELLELRERERDITSTMISVDILWEQDNLHFLELYAGIN